ncbi:MULTISPECIES: aspartyl-phosphate phosphatase Spo0E family protein [Paenibacillaceae]|uniref:aspartyl-phosphate phosphatase Spo0E family protein n=1 Tax=Paenibacillaceae TaxID=186822 RepID=UPI0023687D1A|nr:MULTISPECIES: aspartyl-phosphate phosphatase Spo0E family protein [Paenibacillaceae]
MDDLLRKLEEERRKLNTLGDKLMEQSISLSCSQALQEQSRKVDELVARYYDLKVQRKQRVR